MTSATTDPCHPRAAPTSEPAGGGAVELAALLLGQVWGDQLVQPAQHGVHIHAATLPPTYSPTTERMALADQIE